LVPGASVAAIAQEAGVNANLLFNWRRLHLQAQSPSCPASPAVPRTASVSTIEIDINGARVRVRGPVDEASLRVVLRTLASAG
jgi:transposase